MQEDTQLCKIVHRILGSAQFYLEVTEWVPTQNVLTDSHHCSYWTKLIGLWPQDQKEPKQRFLKFVHCISKMEYYFLRYSTN